MTWLTPKSDEKGVSKLPTQAISLPDLTENCPLFARYWKYGNSCKIRLELKRNQEVENSDHESFLGIYALLNQLNDCVIDDFNCV